MCGHVGIAGKMEFRDEGTMKRLLLMDYFRGTDSTGLASIRKTGDVSIAKIASHPIDLFDTKSFIAANNAFASVALIGHNRAATKGKVNGNNAHPYQYGHIVGAHNGTLDSSSWKALNDALGHETDVDSMAVFACIEKIGIEETVKLLQGAWALVWVDLKEGTLNFLRNSQRPFWIAHTKTLDKVLWASEWPMISAATGMASTTDKYDLYKSDEGFNFFQTEIDYLYTYDLTKLLKGEYESCPDVKGKLLEGKVPPPVVTTPYSYQSPFQGNGGKTKTKTTAADGSPIDQLTIITTGERPFGNFLSADDFVKMCHGKCMYCNEPVHYEDEGLVVFESLEEVLCGDCSGHTTTRLLATPKTFYQHLHRDANKQEKVA